MDALAGEFPGAVIRSYFLMGQGERFATTNDPDAWL
jgi:hypothetical protein